MTAAAIAQRAGVISLSVFALSAAYWWWKRRSVATRTDANPLFASGLTREHNGLPIHVCLEAHEHSSALLAYAVFEGTLYYQTTTTGYGCVTISLSRYAPAVDLAFLPFFSNDTDTLSWFEPTRPTNLHELRTSIVDFAKTHKNYDHQTTKRALLSHVLFFLQQDAADWQDVKCEWVQAVGDG